MFALTHHTASALSASRVHRPHNDQPNPIQSAGDLTPGLLIRYISPSPPGYNLTEASMVSLVAS